MQRSGTSCLARDSSVCDLSGWACRMTYQRAYLDASVPSAYCDERAPDRQRLTQEFWSGRLPDFEAVISDVVLQELEDTPVAEKRQILRALVDDFTVLHFDEEARTLSEEFVRRGIFPERYAADAQHVAIAAVNGVDYLCSWNFTHLVRVATRREVNLANSLMGYGQVEIIAPPEL